MTSEPVARLDRAPVRGAGYVLLLPAAACALLIGFAAGERTSAAFSGIALVAGLAVVALALMRPFWAYAMIAGSVFMLIVVDLTWARLNPIDLLLPPLLAAVFLGTARREAAEREARETGGGHDAIRRARSRFSRAALVYFGLAALSIFFMAVAGRGEAAVKSLLTLLRGVQGLLLFPLGLWLLRDEVRIRRTMAALFAATGVLLAVNLWAVLGLNVQRAGISWWINNPIWPIADPNEAAFAMLLIIAVLMARQAVRPRWWNVLLVAPALAMLFMTYSRSGLLALLTFGALAVSRARWRWMLLAAALLAAVVPFFLPQYAERLAKTLVMQRNSTEAFTSVLRFYSWRTAIRVFLAHPLFGVGYLGLVSVSSAYNELRLVLGAESYTLETAADLGIVGLAALGVLVARLFQLGRAIRRVTPPRTLGHEMAVLHTPLVVGLMMASLTGNTLVGMVGLGQLALWTVLMVRAAHEAVKLAPAPQPPGA